MPFVRTDGQAGPGGGTVALAPAEARGGPGGEGIDAGFTVPASDAIDVSASDRSPAGDAQTLFRGMAFQSIVKKNGL